MMKSKWLLATLAVAALPLASQAADTASEGVTIGGTVADTCLLGTPVQTSASDGALQAGATNASAEITFTNLADASDAQFAGSASVQIMLDGMCNNASTLRITATNGALVNDDVSVVAGSDPFSDQVYYNAIARWGSTNASFFAGGTAGTTDDATYTGALADDIEFEISVSTTNNVGAPLLAGTFDDIVTLQIGTTL